MPAKDIKTFGAWGEEKALDYLKGKGYTVVKRGFRSRFGEIDLIVKDEKYLAFVEVKTRKSKNYAAAREYVGKQKQRKIIKTAQYYMLRNPSKLQPRFDVIEVYAERGEKTEIPEIEHIENAYGV